MGSRCEPNAAVEEPLLMVIEVVELNVADALAVGVFVSSVLASFFALVCALHASATRKAVDNTRDTVAVFMTISEKQRFSNSPIPCSYKSLDVNVLLTFPTTSGMI